MTSVDVYLNGLLLLEGVDWTPEPGSSLPRLGRHVEAGLRDGAILVVAGRGGPRETFVRESGVFVGGAMAAAAELQGIPGVLDVRVVDVVRTAGLLGRPRVVWVFIVTIDPAVRPRAFSAADAVLSGALIHAELFARDPGPDGDAAEAAWRLGLEQ